MEKHWMIITLIAQVITFSFILIYKNPAQTVMFAFFWIATIATLFILLEKKQWLQTEWLTFGILAATIIIAVLFSLDKIIDTIGLGITLIGGLLVSVLLNSIPTLERV